MTTATIIQSARFNSTDSASNAEWVTNLKVPVILNQGDSVTVRQAYADSRLSSSGNIEISVDTPISLTYYFYYMFPCDGANTITPSSTGGADADTGLYGNNSLEDNPNNLVLFMGTPGDPPLIPFQGTNFNTAATGIPDPPYKNIPYEIAPYLAINQSYACDMPLLLVENETIANGSRAYTKTWNYTIKAGSYSPANLADILTKNMAAINPSTPAMNFTPYQQFGGNQTNPMSENATNFNPFLTKGMNYNIETFNYDPESQGQYPNVAPYDDQVVQSNGLAFATNSPEFQNDPSEFAGVFSTFLTDATFDANYLGTFGATIVDDNLPVAILPCKYVAQYNNRQTSSGALTIKHIMSYTSPIVGASEISLQFNTDTNLFQFTYLHTPILQLPNSAATTEPIEVVKVIKTINLTGSNVTDQNIPNGKVNISTNTRHSGVFFQSMEPKSFWQDILGFDVDNITFDADYVWGANRQMNYEEFNNITTSSYIGILNNFNFTKGGINLNNPSYTTAFPLDLNAGEMELTYTNLLNSARWWTEHFSLSADTQFAGPPGYNFDFPLIFSRYYEEYSSASITTNPLSAIQAPLNKSSGHYLISIDGYQNTKQDFINDDDIFNIKSVISNYYLSAGSFATAPFSDTAIYVHNSPIPKVISSLRVRLLEPLTMKEIFGLGPSSSVYLQVNKIVSDVSISQPG